MVAESGCLAALAVVPIFFDLHTVRIFEEAKAPLLRSIAIIIAVALLTSALEGGRSGWRKTRALWRLPVAKPALALTGAYLLSTVTSIAPSISFWGAYTRCQGAYTWLSYVTVFLAMVWLVQQRRQAERFVTVILLASTPVAVYSILQHLGYDFILWQGHLDPVARVTSTAGNPIFVSAYVIMVIPLTLVSVLEQTVIARAPGGRAGRLRQLLSIGMYFALFVLQMLTLVYSQSRGPFIGLCVGLVFATIAFAVRQGMRWLAVSAGALIATGVLSLLLVNLPQTPLETLREAPHLGRLGRIFSVGHGEGGGRVRLLIWQGMAKLLAAEPRRYLTGYGPETILLAYPIFQPAELARLEGRNATPDRSHNETFDALIQTGGLGLAAQLVVLLALLLHILRCLRVINSAGQRRSFLCVAIIGAVFGVVAPYLVDGNIRFSGVGLPTGMIGGLFVYLVARAFTDEGRPEQNLSWSDLLMIGLLAAVVAHFVETQVGIATVATRLHFWVYAALAVAIGAMQHAPGHQELLRLPPGGASVHSGNSVAIAHVVSLIMVTLTFSLYHENLDLRRHAAALSSLFLAVWLVGAFLVAAEPDSVRDGLGRLGRYAALTGGIWLLYLLIHRSFIQGPPLVGSFDPLALGVDRANAASIFYGFVFLVLGSWAAAIVLREPPPQNGVKPPGWYAVMYPWLLVGAAFVITTTNLSVTWADSFNKQAELLERQRQWNAAQLLYQEALRLQPKEDRYVSGLGHMLLEQARSQPGSQLENRDRLLAQAVAAMQRALRINPLNMDNSRNLAATHGTWAMLSEEPSTRAHHANEADTYYAQAVRLSPNNTTVLNDWARLHLQLDDPARALAILNQSLTVDPGYAETYALRAQANLAAGAFEDALGNCEQALAIDPTLLLAWQGKSIALRRLNRLEQAIDAAQAALAVAPGNATSHRNLALLYQDNGQLSLALEEAKAALALAEPEEQGALSAFVAQLEATHPQQ